MNEANKQKFQKEQKINYEELKKVNSYTYFIEKKIKEGKFIYGNSGYTMIGQKIEKYEKNIENMTIEEIKEILDIFEDMKDSFDQKDNSVGEAYCLAHIIMINYKIFKRDYNKLWKYINRIETILFEKNYDYDWVKNIKKTIGEIESKNRYFEREFYSIKKYIKESDLSNMNETNKQKFQKEQKINYEELKKDNSFTNFFEKLIKEGRFIYENTGYIMIRQKIEKYEKNIENMTIEEIKEILDIFEGMKDSLDKKDNSIAEAYCLSHILMINYKYFKRDFNKLWPYINRLKSLFIIKEEENYEWIIEVKKIIKDIEFTYINFDD